MIFRVGNNPERAALIDANARVDRLLIIDKLETPLGLAVDPKACQERLVLLIAYA